MPAPEGYSGLALDYWQRMNPEPYQAPETFSDLAPSEENPGDAPQPDTSPDIAETVSTAQYVMENEEPTLEPIQGDPAHTLVSSDAQFDYWQMYGTDGILYAWKVARGADSRDVSGEITSNGTPNYATATVRENPAPTTPQPAAAGHNYVGTDARGDIWQFYDGERVLEWAVKVNDDSRNVIAGTMTDLGAPHRTGLRTPTAAELAQLEAISQINPPVSVTTSDPFPPVTPPQIIVQTAKELPPLPPPPPPMTTTTARQPGSTGHVYVGTDARGDVWQLFDGTRALEWAVNVNDDSRNVIAGTLRDLGAPVAGPNGTIAQRPATGGPGTGGGGPNGTATPPPPSTVATTTAGTIPTNTVTPNTVTATTARRPGAAGHVYVGTDARGDVWQLFDGTRVLEWAVNVNDDSRNVIAGTLRDLGAPVAGPNGTIAQRPTTGGPGTGGGAPNGTVTQPPPSTVVNPPAGTIPPIGTPAAAAQNTTAAFYVGLAVVALKTLVLT